MKSRVSFLLFIILLFPMLARAQDTVIHEYKNSVKINTAALLFNNVSILMYRNYP
jgi:hypothetical protein